MKFALGQSVPRTEDPRLLTGRGRYTDDFVLARHGACLCAALAPCACAHPRDRRARGAADAGRARGAHRRRLGGGEIRRLPARHSAQAPRRLADVRAAAARRSPRTAPCWSAIPSPSSSPRASSSPRTRPSASSSSTSRCPRSPRPRPGAGAGRAEAVGRNAATTRCFFYTRRRQARGRCRLRQGASRHAPEARLQPHHRGDDGAARLRRRIRRPRSAATRSISGTQRPHGTRADMARRVLNIPENADARRRRRCRRQLRHEGRAFPGISAGASGPRARSAARSNGSPSAARACCPTTTTATMSARPSWRSTRTARFLALRVKNISNIGAYLAPGGIISPTMHLGGLAGTYTTPAIYVEVSAVFTNTTSIGPYRGSGRPEASYIIERLIDNAAREMGIDRAELRRRNTVPSCGDAVQDRPRLHARLRRVREESRHGAAPRRLPPLRAPPRRGPRPRQAARHRRRQHHRADLADDGRDGDGEVRSRRHGHGHPRLDLARPGPRDDVQDPAERAARPRRGRHPRDLLRHRSGALRRRHVRLAHRRPRRQRRHPRRRQDHRQGEEDRGAHAWRPPKATSNSTTARSASSAPTRPCR